MRKICQVKGGLRYKKHVQLGFVECWEGKRNLDLLNEEKRQGLLGDEEKNLKARGEGG